MSKLKQMLDKYRNQGGGKMKVGIMSDKVYPDGHLVANIGYIQEYGYEGIIVPEREHKIYHSINKDGSMRHGGKFVKASKANLERTVTIKSYKINIPARPFFRTATTDSKEELKELIASIVRTEGVEAALSKAGEFMVGALTESVMTWTEPPNAPSTIAQKGYNAPLRGKDKQLRNSFTYEIEP